MSLFTIDVFDVNADMVISLRALALPALALPALVQTQTIQGFV